jgi:two-component system NtrC family sensor kinase
MFRYAQVGTCVNGVTHDINNILGAILAYAELVSLDSGISDESHRMLNEVIKGVDKCGALVTEITAIARKDSDNESAAELGVLVQNILNLRDYSLKIAGIAVDVQIDTPLPSSVMNAPRIQMAILYLLTNAQNALKGESRGLIRIKVGRASEGQELVVWNSAPPIPESHRRSIFEPFTTTREGVHLGLGLHLARGIVEKHQGTLSYDADRGFIIYLPMNTGTS